MNKVKLCLLLPLFLGLPLFASEYWETHDTSTEGNIDEKKEVHLAQEALLGSKDAHTGLVTRKYYTGHDDFKIYAMGHISEDLAFANDLIGLEAGAAKKMKWFWAHLFVSHQNAKFKGISENRALFHNPNNMHAEENFVREGENTQMVNTLGLGLGLRSKLNLGFLPTERVFQNTTAFFTYSELDESYRNLKYLGPGLRADYALEHRVGNTFYYAPVLTYNFAIVERAVIGSDEINNDRRLYLSYLTLGLHLGLYF